MSVSLPPRLTDEPLPPYSYVPGKFPHPVRDPEGHSFGHETPLASLPRIGDWRSCREYLRGIDLFNYGYYWEAHESWEAVWNALGRRGPEADFLKALIKLAAAGVKAREGRPEGVARHAARARELLSSLEDLDSGRTKRWGGLRLEELIAAAVELIDHPQAAVNPSDAPTAIVTPLVLRPRFTETDDP